MESMTSLASSMAFDEAVDLIPNQSHDESQFDLLPPEPSSAAGGFPAPPNITAPDHPSEPLVGMEFESDDLARSFYCAYADRLGFRVRNSKSFTSRVDDKVIMRRFVCSRQGRPTKKDPFDLSKKRRNRPSTRQGCRAMMQVNRRPETARWAISRVILDHCHPLGVTSDSPSSKKPQKRPWELLLCGLDNSAPQPAAQHHGLGPGGGVAQSLLEYFKKMQADSPAFFYSVQIDEANCVSNMFWADARARMAYGYFGDAVTFDITCKRNKRVVPFVAFRGVNHHRQLVVFGCALMTDESVASYVWLFETWLTLMGGRRPVSLTTPFDEAVESAVACVLPSVRHRFCKRDVFTKCKEKLAGVYDANSAFKSQLKKVVKESVSVEDFELGWKSLIERYNLVDNVWLQTLFDVREKWVHVYVRDSFFAEFPGAQKSETMQKFFQRHSITTTTLRDLVTQFDKAMAGQCEKEVQADITMANVRPVLRTASPMEKQASEIYTRDIFNLFQEEFVESSSFLMDKLEDDGFVNTFRVTKVEDSTRSYIVTYDASEKAIRCSCCMFEFSGILCRHAFRVCLVVGILNIPDEYISRRWTKNAKCNILSNDHCSAFQSDCLRTMAMRCNDLCRDAFKFAEEGSTSATIYNVAKSAFHKAFAELFAAKQGPFFSESRKQ